MISKRDTFISLIFILFNLTGIYLSVSGQGISAIDALRLFDRERYEEAEQLFGRLLYEDPDNTMLNYYYGACRTENGHYTDTDLNYLLKAGRTVTPHRINYYLGIQYHAKEEWEQALKFYNQFRMSVPESEQQELKINERIQQCYDKVNPFGSQGAPTTEADQGEQAAERYIMESSQPVSSEAPLTETTGQAPVDEQQDQSVTPPPAAPPVAEAADTVTAGRQALPAAPAVRPTMKKESGLDISRRALPDLPGVKPTVALPEGEFIEFRINNSVTYLHTSHFRTEKGKELFSQAHAMQKKLDKNLEKVAMLRREYRQTDDANMRSTIGQEILSIENETYGMQEMINQLRRGCLDAENEYWQKADGTELNNFIIELNKIKTLKEGSYAEAMATDTKNDEPIIIIDPSELLITPDITPGRQRAAELVYKVQIGAYSRGVPAHIKRLYNKLEMLRRIDNYTDENGVVVYTTGSLTNLDDAVKMRDQVRQEGIKDAQVVPYFQGKRITLEQAKEIEAGR